jgi:hypothetical protein
MMKKEIEKILPDLTGIIEDCIELKIFNGNDKLSMFEVYKFAIQDLLPHAEFQDSLLKESIELLEASNNRIYDLIEKHSCGDLEKFLMPVIFSNQEFIEKWRDE